MKRIVNLFAICAAAAAGLGAAQLEKMPPALETRFALSALPPVLRDGAAVYLLDPARGYVAARAGKNGQHCMVERTEWRQEEFRDDLYTAMCYDSAGLNSQMKVRFDVAELRAKGLSAAAVKKEIEKRLADGAYPAPKRAGFSYMAGPLMRTYMSVDPKDHTVMTMPMPHIMYYAPNVTDAEVGGIPPLSPYPFVYEQGPLGYFIQRLGDRETEAILVQEAALVRDLCAYRGVLCLTGGEPPVQTERHPSE